MLLTSLLQVPHDGKGKYVVPPLADPWCLMHPLVLNHAPQGDAPHNLRNAELGECTLVMKHNK